MPAAGIIVDNASSNTVHLDTRANDTEHVSKGIYRRVQYLIQLNLSNEAHDNDSKANFNWQLKKLNKLNKLNKPNKPNSSNEIHDNDSEAHYIGINTKNRHLRCHFLTFQEVLLQSISLRICIRPLTVEKG